MPGIKDICSTLFEITAEKFVRPAGGRLLVAEPFLDEEYFSHSVVSLIDYERGGGAMGVVLNRRTPTMLADVLEDDSIKCDVPVFCGGPLALDRVFFLHTLGSDISPGARPYAPGMYVGGDFDAITDYVNSGYGLDGVVRFFVGYSGWDEGQLEQEIAEGTWALAEAAPGVPLLSGHGDTFWHRAVRGLGESYRPWRLVPRLTCSN